MATRPESYFQRRARELGLNLNPTTPAPVVPQTSSFLTRRRTELQQEREAQIREQNATVAPSASYTPSTLRNVQNLQEQRLNPTGTPGRSTAVTNRLLEENPVPTFQQQIQNATRFPEYTPTYQEEMQEKARNLPVVGSAIGGALDVLNRFSENPVVKTTGEIGGMLYTPGAGLQNVLGAQGAIRAGLSRVAPKLGLGEGTGARVAQEAITEGILGAPLTAGNVLAQNPGVSGKELAKQTAIGAGLGAAGGAIGPAVEAGLNALVSRAAQNIARNNVNAAGAIASVAEGSVSAPGRLRVQNNTERLSKLIGEIKPTVIERMTPPLENQNALAKWLQPHLGESLNQIRRLSYEDMRQLAQEVQRNMTVEDVARQVAKERGQDLDALLNQTAPTFKQQAERLRLGGVAGAIEPPSNARIAISGAPGEVVEEVATEAPAMKGNWFTSVFGNRGLGIRAGSQGSGRNKLTTEGQIVDNPLRMDRDGVKVQSAALTRAARQNFEDYTQPLKHLGEDTYDIAQDARRANNLANTTINDKFVDVEGNVIGQSLKEIGNKIARGEGNAFQDYLILRHAKTRVGRGEKVYADNLNMNDVNKIQSRIDELDRRYPKFAAIAEEWDGYWKNLRNLWQKEGLITAEQNAAMEAANPFYSPMRRQFSASEKYTLPFTNPNGFSGQKAPIKEVSPTGSVRKIVNPFRSAIEQTGASYNAIMRNRVMQNVYQKLRQNPELLKGIVEIVPESADVMKKQLDEINKIIRDDGIEGLAEKLDTDFLKVRKGAQKSGKTDNVVTAMIDGKPVKMRVENPELFDSLVGLSPQEANIVIGMFSALSEATKFGATGVLAPLFAARSLTTDVVQSIIQSKNPLYHMLDLGYAVLSSIADLLPRKAQFPLRELAQDFRRTGGEYSAYLMGDRRVNRNVRRILREPYLSGRNIARTAASPVTGTFKLANKLSDISENLNRMAAYRGELRRQGNARTPESIRAAMRESQEITTNFSRRGRQSQNIEAFIPYSNAAIQGLRRFARQWKKNPVKTAALVGAMILAPKAWEYFKFSDDPDYQKIPAREKYRNLFFNKNADGSFDKIPMPAEYNGIGAAMVDLLTAYKDGDSVNWRQSADAVVNAYTPPFLSGLLQGVTQGGGPEQSIVGFLNSTSLAAPIAVAANQSFTGAPIVPQRLQGSSPKQQYDETTSEVGKWVGDKLGMSPKKVDYLIRAYGGDPARLLLPLTSDVGAGTTRNTLLKNFITDPVFTNTLANDYFDMKEKITQAEADNRINGVPFPSWYKESIADLVTSQKKGGISKRLSELTSQKRDVQGDKTLDAEQKSRKLRDIQSKMNEIYLDAVTKMRDGGVPTGR